MLITTKGRYALRLMLELAQYKGEYMSLNDIAKKQGISLKYLESIASKLQSGNLILSMRGKSGGYKLAKKAENISLGEVLNTSQDGLSTVECQANQAGGCINENDCLTKQLWVELNDLLNVFFGNISLRDLVNSKKKEIELLGNEKIGGKL